MVEALRQRHQVIIYANGHAYEMLAPVYLGTEVQVHELPRVMFRYGPGKRLSYVRTGVMNMPYFARMPQLIKMVLRHWEQTPPDLVITDFEPVLPRAADAAGLPFIALNHQHFLTAYDLSDLSAPLRAYTNFMAPFVNIWHSKPLEQIISSFFFAPVKASQTHVVPVGVLIRPELRRATIEDRGHLVAYVRRTASDRMLMALGRGGRPGKVYGLGAQPSRGDLSFHPIDPFRFVEHLATSSGLVTTTGNQLVGESLWLGKPVFGMPEIGNYEQQQIHTRFLVRSGAGMGGEMSTLTAREIQTFLDRIPQLRAAIDRRRLDGLPVALGRVEHHLVQRPGQAPLVERLGGDVAPVDVPQPSSFTVSRG